MKLRFIRYACVLWVLLSAVVMQAQNSGFYSTADGLPSSHISHMTFDANNFLWVSTDMGLARFNGNRFSVYQAEYGSPHRLQENQVNKLHIDRDGQYWVAGCDGLYFLDHTRNSFTRYSISAQRNDISVSDIVDHPLRPHSLIVTTYGWGMRIFDTQAFAFDSVASQSLMSAIQRTPSYIHVDAKGNLWGFHDRDIDHVNLSTMEVRHLSDYFAFLKEPGCNVSHCVEDTLRGMLYLGTSTHGLLRADIHNQYVTPVSLPANHVTALAMAPDGTLTVGTENQGLWTYDPSSDQAYLSTWPGLLRLALGPAKIHSITYDSRQNLWLGLYQRGVMVLPRQDLSIFRRQSISLYPGTDGINLASVTGFSYLPDGSRAYALDGGGVVVDYADGSHMVYNSANSCMTTDAVLSLTTLPHGTLLAGTYQCGVFVIDPDRRVRRDSRFASLEMASITDFENDTIGQVMYIATNGLGLYAYDYTSRELSQPVPDSYGIKWINNLFLSSDRRLWISRADHLSYVDLNDGSIHSPRQFNSRVVVNGFAETDDKRLWLATTHGLMRYDADLDSLVVVNDPDEGGRRSFAALMNSHDGRLWLASAGSITSYDIEHGRFSHYVDPVIASVGTINYHSSKRWPDQSFSFGGDHGIINFRPSDVDNYQLPNRTLLLTSLWVDNVPTDYDPSLPAGNVLDRALWCAQELRLPHSRASFSLSFAMQDLNGETGIVYQHRLLGYDEEWHPIHGGAKTVNYQSLPPGDYSFIVRAYAENDATASTLAERQLRVVILPPWYATWWASLIWLLLALIIVWIVFRQVADRRKARHELRQAETERQVKEGKFNMLTSVSHEIKTPLTLIISPLRKMLGRKSDPATQSVLEMMYRNSLRILMLVNQQMDVRKLDRGELPLHVSELPLRSFLNDLMQYFSSVALSRHITYTLNFPDGQDELSLWADSAQLDKVVMNLLSNAIKFVPDNGRISIDVTPVDAQHTQISVYNSGSQLPADQQTLAFSGIGLSIAREITELHHGTLSVRNLDDGVSFDIVLLNGNSHFTPEELIEVRRTADSFDRVEPISDIPVGFDTERPEVVSSVTADEEDKERELAEQLNDELREKKRMRERREALDLSSAQEPVKMSSADEKLMRRVMDLIHKNISDSEFSVESLSSDLGISRVHLNRKLKELIDISPSQLIKSVRLKQAALLLIQSNVTVSEVAYSVGFSSPAYFTTNFTQYYGMTPKEFTNTYTEKPDSPELKQLLG